MDRSPLSSRFRPLLWLGVVFIAVSTLTRFALLLATGGGVPATFGNWAKASFAGHQFSNVDLSGANLAGADLRNARLVNVNLDKANLTGANLSGAQLLNVSLEGALTQGVIWTDGRRR